MALSHVGALLLFLFLVAPQASSGSGSRGFRVDLNHVDSMGDLTKLERLQRGVQRSRFRVARLTAKATASNDSISDAVVPVRSSSGEYLMELGIGTPAWYFPAILDTGSDLIWTQCRPCARCFTQPTPLFNPLQSSTFSTLPCTSELCLALPASACSQRACLYSYSYMDGSSTQGVLGRETFTFGSTNQVSIPNIGFGCGQLQRASGSFNESGLVGLGRGPLSLVSQLGLGMFSYCLTTFNDSMPSPLLFGSAAELNGSTGGLVQSTPLIRNPSIPTFYYLSLTSITVGSTLLPIPNETFALKKNGTGGLIIDSGTTITYLEEAGYDLVKKAFLSQLKLPVADGSVEGLDLCFSLPSDSPSAAVQVPKLIFHFDGADMNLPQDNYMFNDSSNGLLCLTINGTSGVSILGNFQQQNFHILYDLENEKLSFTPVQCDQL